MGAAFAITAFCLSNGFIIIFWMAKANRLKVLVYICCGDMSLFPSFLYNDLQFWISLRHHKPSNGFVVIYGRGKPIAKRISAQPLGGWHYLRVFHTSIRNFGYAFAITASGRLTILLKNFVLMATANRPK